ncbi:MAG: hypothetical protein JOZ48_00270, partial [Acidobacteriaceae bacterium]|nr:hypothetical protein [Acidobacteriaceae bacterium]
EHAWLIDEVFDRAREAGLAADTYADRLAAIAANVAIDQPSLFNDHYQFLHSMRPSGVSLNDTRIKTNEFIDEELRAAIIAAKAKNKYVAGWHLGLMLHTIQDGKHNFCSCSESSNPPDSSTACNSTGPCSTGLGNHGFVNGTGCLVPSLRSNFQMNTDRFPTRQQLRAAGQTSLDYVRKFVDGVRQP